MNKTNYNSEGVERLQKKIELKEALGDVAYITIGGLIIIMLIEAFTVLF